MTANTTRHKHFQKSTQCSKTNTYLWTGLLGGTLSDRANGTLKQGKGYTVQLEHLLAEDVRGGAGRSGTLHQSRLVG